MSSESVNEIPSFELLIVCDWLAAIVVCVCYVLYVTKVDVKYYGKAQVQR